jgi:predicted alpha/beta-hydrolase family hydrolase
VEAADLQALARALPLLGIEVVLVTQPYRVEGNNDVADEPSLDRAWTAIWPAVSAGGVPVVVGGRSAGSQVACRTARALDAHSVLALRCSVPAALSNCWPQCSPPQGTTVLIHSHG